jgi:hypothetical protein
MVSKVEHRNMYKQSETQPNSHIYAPKGFQNIEHLQLYKMHRLTTEPQAPPTGLFYQQ